MTRTQFEDAVAAEAIVVHQGVTGPAALLDRSGIPTPAIRTEPIRWLDGHYDLADTRTVGEQAVRDMLDAAPRATDPETHAARISTCDATPHEIVDALYGSARAGGQFTELATAVGRHFPAVLDDPRVVRSIEADRARATREAAAAQEKARREVLLAEHVAVDEPVRAEVVALAAGGGLVVDGDGWVQPRTHKARGKRMRTGVIARAELAGYAVPLAPDQHLVLTTPLRWRWQESPAEPDVSGVFTGFTGRRVDTAAASKLNTRIMTARVKRSAAERQLGAALDEIDQVPTGSTLIADCTTQHGYGVRHLLAPDGRYVRSVTEYDWPARVSAAKVSRRLLQTALGLTAAQAAGS